MSDVDSTVVLNGVEYRLIPGYDWYAISRCGKIIGYHGRGGGNGKWGRRTLTKIHGYLKVGLCRKGEQQRYFNVHRLVLLTWIGPPPSDKPLCCHRDGNPENNTIGNLYWGSQKENIADSIRHGTRPKGVRNGRCKLSESDVREIRRRREEHGETNAVIADAFGVGTTTVSGICTRRTWGHVA